MEIDREVVCEIIDGVAKMIDNVRYNLMNKSSFGNIIRFSHTD
jgi:hypothetical protein